MYERTAAQLATLQSIAEAEGADLVSSGAVAPMLRAIEESTRGESSAPSYISAGADVLVGTILRHAKAIERLEDMPIEEVVALAKRLAEPRRRFQKLVRTYVEDVIQSPDPQKSADGIYRKHLAPEIDAFDASFGGIFRTVKSYAVDLLRGPTLVTAVPLAALGLAAGINTAWTLAVAGAYSAAKTSSAKRAWPRILFELRSST